ncbi:MAG: NAD(P)-dependent alcohol dehydrogenase [Pseudomonadota bacterium]
MLRWILFSVLGLLGAGILGLVAAMSYTSDCSPADSPGSTDGSQMLAATYSCYGPPKVVNVAPADIPDIASDEVLVKVEAAAVNPYDWHFMRGSPYFMRLMVGIGRPKDTRLGVDFAGTVMAAGEATSRFKVGDRVYGGATGAFAELVSRRETGSIAAIPDNVSFAQAASVPIAGITALQALRDHGALQAGERVLINGASGGVGTFAVQIAKSMGAHVTGVCSDRNIDMVKGIGADIVINYKTDDYTTQDERYDLILDMVGNHSPLRNRDVLTPNGRLVIIGGPSGDWLGPLARPILAAVANLWTEQELTSMTGSMTQSDMELLAEMMEDGRIVPVIDRHYPLAEVRDAIRYSESGRARGKIILDIAALSQ